MDRAIDEPLYKPYFARGNGTERSICRKKATK
jgi:hypothetical protein